jgi:hypothetical protein
VTFRLNHARIWAVLAARAATLVAVAVLIAPSPAAAGSYTVTFNANSNTQPGCSIWSMSGSLTFGYNPPCSTAPLGFYGGGCGSSACAEPAGARIGIQTVAPAGVTITSAFVSPWYIYDINNGQGWGGGSYYTGGGRGWTDADTQELDPSFSSSYWGFQMICGWSSCSNFGGIYVNSIQLTATENQGPALTAVGSGNLWYQGSHWIWNAAGDPWSIALSGTDPSGVCQMWAVLNGTQINSPGQTPDTAVWQQCPDWTWNASVDTRDYVASSGPLSLTLAGSNAAGVASAPSETLHVDNQPLQLSLSGPTLASTTDGTQYVTATANAGPSGVAIGCSVDGSPVQWQNGATDQVPVAGVGDHTVSCQAHNGAIDPQGQYAYSATQNWTLDIGQPTVSVIGFAKIVNALKCDTARKKVTIPARWVSVRRHHKLAKIRKPARTKTVTVKQCHPRIVWRREKVWVRVRRHGKLVSVRRTKRVRVTLLPHTVMQTKKRVDYGRGTTVNGWLGTAGGVGVGGAPVEILTAPNNGQGQFTPTATATTGANGSWTAQLGPGPSRLVEATYGGSPTLLATTSAAVQTITPAEIRIKITPTIVPWGSKIRVTGRVLGGYVPSNSNLLRLNVGIGRIGHLEGLPQIQPNGRFVIVWKFDPGHGVLHPWFSVGTLAESAFPYSPGMSKRIVITVGEPTPPARHHHRAAHHHHKRKHKKRSTRR